MTVREVSSSMLKRIGYDPQNAVLYAEFNKGSVYAYHGVPESVFVSICVADSHGKAFRATVLEAGYGFEAVTLAEFDAWVATAEKRFVIDWSVIETVDFEVLATLA